MTEQPRHAKKFSLKKFLLEGAREAADFLVEEHFILVKQLGRHSQFVLSAHLTTWMLGFSYTSNMFHSGSFALAIGPFEFLIYRRLPFASKT